MFGSNCKSNTHKNNNEQCARFRRRRHRRRSDCSISQKSFNDYLVRTIIIDLIIQV